MILEEKRSYIFRISKIIEICGKDYFVFIGPDSKKYLISVNNYFHYELKIGEEVICRVDKINCKGEIFLEPENPHYKENEVYDFVVNRTEPRLDNKGIKQICIIVKDRFGDEISVPINIVGDSTPQKGAVLKLRIEKITKGKINITSFNREDLTGQLSEGMIYDFLIIDEIKGLDNRDFFIVEDKFGTHHTIPVDYYKHYGIKLGETFKGNIRQYREDTRFRVEPLNPFFRPGEKYSFEVQQVVKLGEDENDNQVLILRDKYGFLHDFGTTGNFEIGEKLSLKVSKIRKGWPLLEQL